MQCDFSTSSVQPADRLSAWQEVVRNACVPLSVRAEHNGFRGTLGSRDVDALCLSMVDSVEHIGCHDKPQVSLTGSDVLLASLHIVGDGLLEQDGRAAALSGNDLVLYDAMRPFAWSFPAGFRQLVVRIPRAALKYRLARANSYTAKRLPCANGLARVAGDFLLSLYREAPLLDPAAARRAADCAIDLVVAAITDQVEARVGPATDGQALLLNRALAHIADRLRDPELGPQAIADALGISVRYLHYLFRAQGRSVGHHILEQRLAGCARDLERSNAHGTAVSTIAYAWGFNNAAHFSRVFRNAFGLSARDYRAAYRAGGALPGKTP